VPSGEIVQWQNLNPRPIVGVDEVGRGCLAGPVFAAAVILDDSVQGTFFDSKKLSEKRRNELAQIVFDRYAYGVGFATVDEIDRINIFQASLLAMRRAVEALKLVDGHVLVDGKYTIPQLPSSLRQTAFIQGDARVEPISAASIVAKVLRDRLMVEMSQKFSGYGFEVHKGYATIQHQRAIAAMGPCEIHRRSFRWGDEGEKGRTRVAVRTTSTEAPL